MAKVRFRSTTSELGPLIDRVRALGVDVLGARETGATVDVVVACDAESAEHPLADCLECRAAAPVLVVVRALDPEQAWRLVERGACDVLDASDADQAAAVVVARANRFAKIDELLGSRAVRETLVGTSAPWRRCLAQLAEVAYFSQANVLITGESGTGKELAAGLVHALDARERKGPLVVVDCSTLSPELGGSELFGHTRGAYTGAIAERDGALSQANGGTLFLDELGELPPQLQAQLLRATEAGAYKPVGATQWKRSAFRLVCATNRELEAEVRAGRFRLDLFHRVMAWHVHLPPLRERPEDIVPLARHFAKSIAVVGRVPEFTPAVERYLVTRDYPGNLRDLRQLMLRMMTRHDGDGPVTPGDIPPGDRPSRAEQAWPDEEFERAIRRGVLEGHGMKTIGRAAESVALHVALEVAQGNSRRAAEVLGVTERAVQLRRSTQGHSA